jgi:hypothetical protein
MLTLKDCHHLRTASVIKGFRACPTSTGISRAPAAGRRRGQEEAALARREARRRWLAQDWQDHLWFCRRRQGLVWVML